MGVLLLLVLVWVFSCCFFFFYICHYSSHMLVIVHRSKAINKNMTVNSGPERQINYFLEISCD